MRSSIPDAAREEHEKASACVDDRRFVESIVHAEAATRLAPEWAAPWWNLTVGYKHARDWEKALAACERAIALAPDDAEGPHWNAGIAATALGRWERARAAWAALGIDVPDGDGPLDMDLGPAPVRISPDDHPEVVWCQRIDPCRAQIRSVPLPESGRRYLDLVLHDGEPRGRRKLGDRSLAVFDELALLEESAFGTFEVRVRCGDEAELATVVSSLEAEELGVEDWTTSVRMLCAKCSLGDPDDGHEHDAPEPSGWNDERRLGVAARDESDLRPLRMTWLGWRRNVVAVRRLL